MIVNLIKDKTKAQASRLLGLGQEIEDVWDADPVSLASNLLALRRSPLDMAQVEAAFKEADLKQPRPNASPNSGQLKALEKSLKETQNTIQAYKTEAADLRQAANHIFADMAGYDPTMSVFRATSGSAGIMLNR